MDKANKNYPTRSLKPIVAPDGSMHWKSCTHGANIGGEICPNPDLPGLIIFVHGVNSEGEWYEKAEDELCKGLNERLNLPDKFRLEPNTYYKPKFNPDEINPDNSRFIYEKPIRTLEKLGRSPVIRFYWGYRAQDDELDDYRIPLKNENGDSFHRLKAELIHPTYSTTSPEQLSPQEKANESMKRQLAAQYAALTSDKKKKQFICQSLKDKGPFFWGGGPFQNGCNNLVSLWSKSGFNNWPMLYGKIPVPAPFPIPVNVQLLNPESDRLLTAAPPREYYAHAAGRLANIIETIRKNNPNDTVTVISHSQGTMVALAAAALAPPDALFVLNSPYALDDMTLNAFSYSFSENINEAMREATLADIIKKVATRKNTLKQSKDPLIVGLDEQKNDWHPDIAVLKKKRNIASDPLEVTLQDIEGAGSIPERDNHGNTYIYCNPHDRVMGSSPLRSIGWSGLLNSTEKGISKPHPLFSKVSTLYVRMLARNTDCGKKPDTANNYTSYSLSNGNFRDGNVFWDSNTKMLSGIAWPNPEPNLFININAPEVCCPIEADELKTFDEDFPIEQQKNNEEPTTKTELNKEKAEKDLRIGLGYGKWKIDKNTGGINPADTDYYYYRDIYSYGERVWQPLSKEQKKQISSDPLRTPQERNQSYEYEMMEQMQERIREYIQRPTDHSTLPQNVHFLRRVITYDLPIGHCAQGNNPEKLAELRNMADWLRGGDNYFNNGKLTLPGMPDEIGKPNIVKNKTDLDRY